MNKHIGAGLAALVLLAAAWTWRDRALDRALLTADANMIPSELVQRILPAGKKVYDSRCAGCHGAGGKGDPEMGVPILADNDWLYGGAVSDIEQTIANGIRAANGKTRALAVMPAYATPRPSLTEPIPPLAPGDIADVTEFVLLLGGRAQDQDAAGRGAAIFQDKGGCFDCHGADGKGDPAIGAPDLTDAIWLRGDGSKDAIAETIALGSAGLCPAWAGILDARAVRATALYVHSLSQPR